MSTQTTLARSVGRRRYVQHSPPGGDTVVQSTHCYVDDDGVQCSDVSESCLPFNCYCPVPQSQIGGDSDSVMTSRSLFSLPLAIQYAAKMYSFAGFVSVFVLLIIIMYVQ